LYYCHRFYTRPSDTSQRRSFSFLPGAVPRRNVRGTLWRGSGASPPLAGLEQQPKTAFCLLHHSVSCQLRSRALFFVLKYKKYKLFKF
jgi:hypothetical protein